MKRLFFTLILLVATAASAQVSVEITSGITTEITGSLEIALDGNWTNNGTLTLTSGDLDLNGNEITLGTNALLAETAGNRLLVDELRKLIRAAQQDQNGPDK